MDIFNSWDFMMFYAVCILGISAAVLGYLIGYRSGKKQERFEQAKERLKRDTAFIFRLKCERDYYAERIELLENVLKQPAESMEQYEEDSSELAFCQRQFIESKLMIDVLSEEYRELADANLLSLLIQIKGDPLHTNLTRDEWSELFKLTDLLFNNVLTELKEKYSITRHEQEIACLVKWNFSRKEQLALFNNTSEALTKSKNRMKKKLKLDENSELDAFLRLY